MVKLVHDPTHGDDTDALYLILGPIALAASLVGAIGSLAAYERTIPSFEKTKSLLFTAVPLACVPIGFLLLILVRVLLSPEEKNPGQCQYSGCTAAGIAHFEYGIGPSGHLTIHVCAERSNSRPSEVAEHTDANGRTHYSAPHFVLP